MCFNYAEIIDFKGVVQIYKFSVVIDQNNNVQF